MSVVRLVAIGRSWWKRRPEGCFDRPVNNALYASVLEYANKAPWHHVGREKESSRADWEEDAEDWKHEEFIFMSFRSRNCHSLGVGAVQFRLCIAYGVASVDSLPHSTSARLVRKVKPGCARCAEAAATGLFLSWCFLAGTVSKTYQELQAGPLKDFPGWYIHIVWR